jgi:hypothetical protein
MHEIAREYLGMRHFWDRQDLHGVREEPFPNPTIGILNDRLRVQSREVGHDDRIFICIKLQGPQGLRDLGCGLLYVIDSSEYCAPLLALQFQNDDLRDGQVDLGEPRESNQPRGLTT